MDPAAPAAPRLPDGTRVVLQVTVYDTAGAPVRGAAGRIAGEAARGRYKVELADGRAVVAARGQLRVLPAEGDALALAGVGPAPGEGHRLVGRRTAYAAVVGPRVAGPGGPVPVAEVRGVYVAPAEAFFSLVKPPPYVEGPEPGQFSWELERFCGLALRADPDLLEVLNPPRVAVRTAVGDELVGLREAFLSRLAYRTYSDHALARFERAEAALRGAGAPDWPGVAHLLRLLVTARDLLATGRLAPGAAPEHDRLRAAGAGELPWPEIERWRRALHAEVDDAYARTPLPPGPDAVRVDAWLRSVRARDIRGGLDLRR